MPTVSKEFGIAAIAKQVARNLIDARIRLLRTNNQRNRAEQP